MPVDNCAIDRFDNRMIRARRANLLVRLLEKRCLLHIFCTSPNSYSSSKEPASSTFFLLPFSKSVMCSDESLVVIRSVFRFTCKISRPEFNKGPRPLKFPHRDFVRFIQFYVTERSS